MILAIDWLSIWQSLEEAWLPILILMGIITLIIIAAVLKGNKD